jgi:hypothetical protein
MTDWTFADPDYVVTDPESRITVCFDDSINIAFSISPKDDSTQAFAL